MSVSWIIMRVSCLSLLYCIMAPAVLWAQGSVSGVVRDQAGQPVSSALVVLDAESGGPRVRTDDGGRFLFQAVAAGPHEMRVVRIGYQPYQTNIAVANEAVHVDVALRALPVPLDTIAVRASRPGLYGLVATRGMELLPHEPRPLRGAIVEVLDSPFRATTGGDGRFSLPELGEGAWTVLVRIDRYQSRIIPAYVPRDGGVEVTVVLDSTVADYQRRDDDQLRGISERLRNAVNPSTLVGTQELLESGMANVDGALRFTPATLSRGMVLRDDVTCIYMDGVPRPGMTAKDIPVDEVQAVEVYGATTRPLPLMRLAPWPMGTFCGTGRRQGPTQQPIDRPSGERTPRSTEMDNIARFIVIWTRKR